MVLQIILGAVGILLVSYILATIQVRHECKLFGLTKVRLPMKTVTVTFDRDPKPVKQVCPGLMNLWYNVHRFSSGEWTLGMGYMTESDARDAGRGHSNIVACIKIDLEGLEV